MFLWYLADRWGTVRTDGVLVPVSLTHATLSELIAARRQTVSSALGALERDGLVRQCPDGLFCTGRRRAWGTRRSAGEACRTASTQRSTAPRSAVHSARGGSPQAMGRGAPVREARLPEPARRSSHGKRRRPDAAEATAALFRDGRRRGTDRSRATKLHVQPQTVTQAIASLESDLGFTVLEPHARGVRLTPPASGSSERRGRR